MCLLLLTLFYSFAIGSGRYPRYPSEGQNEGLAGNVGFQSARNRRQWRGRVGEVYDVMLSDAGKGIHEDVAISERDGDLN